MIVRIMLRARRLRGHSVQRNSVVAEGDPVTSSSNRDEAYTNVTNGIRNAVNDLLRKEQQKTKDLLATSLDGPHRRRRVGAPSRGRLRKAANGTVADTRKKLRKDHPNQSQVTSGRSASQERCSRSKESDYLQELGPHSEAD